MITQMIFRALDKKASWLIVVIMLVAVAVPACNLLIPAGQFGHVPGYLVTLFGKYLCYAVLALSLDLVWGYVGILSLGHGAFFALGGYAMGMYLMRQIGSRGVYANPILPDFMVFLNWKELPWYWHGFDMFWFAMVMVVLVPGLLAFVFGWFAFRSRVTGVYLSIITQAMTFALLLAFFRNDFGFGGNNGLTDFKDILGFNVQAASTRAALDAIDVLRSFNGPGLRHQIAHASFVDPAEIPRFAELDVVADLSPPLWFPSVIIEAIRSAVPQPLVDRIAPIRSLIDAGALVAGGSDWPVVPDPSPWPSIQGMVTRRDPTGRLDGALCPEEAIGVEEALRAYTIQAAQATGLAHLTGSIEVGKSADLAILDTLLFDVDPGQLGATEVLQTWFEGRCVHGATA